MMSAASPAPNNSAASSNKPAANSIAIVRLTEERKQWRKDHPFGFYAKPVNNADGTANLMVWECGIPGKANSIWEGGVYKLKVVFSDSYPSSPPKCQFSPPLPHPNIFPSGYVCLSLLNTGWKPAITLKQLLLGIQQLFDEPNLKSPANHDMYILYRENKKRYEEKVREFAKHHRPAS